MVQIHIKKEVDAALPEMQLVFQDVRELCQYGVGQNPLTGEWICLPSSNEVPSTSYFWNTLLLTWLTGSIPKMKADVGMKFAFPPTVPEGEGNVPVDEKHKF